MRPDPRPRPAAVTAGDLPAGRAASDHPRVGPRGGQQHPHDGSDRSHVHVLDQLDSRQPLLAPGGRVDPDPQQGPAVRAVPVVRSSLLAALALAAMATAAGAACPPATPGNTAPPLQATLK